MGGKSSKSTLQRNTPIRQSQTKRLGIIKRKCDSIAKRLKNLKDKDKSSEPAVYDELEKEALSVQNLLQEISPELKEKYKNAFDDYVSKCDNFLEEINTCRDSKKNDGDKDSEIKEEENTQDQSKVNTEANVKPIRTPVHENKLVEENAVDSEITKTPLSKTPSSLDATTLERPKKVTKSDVPDTPISEASFSYENTTIERRKKKVKKSKNDVYTRKISIEEKSFQAIDKIRMEMSDLRDEVLTFKGTKDDQLYHFLKESFLRYISKLEDIDIFDNKQIKYERRLAIAFARDSITALKELAEGTDVNKVRRSLIEHDQLSKIQCVSKNDLLDLPGDEETRQSNDISKVFTEAFLESNKRIEEKNVTKRDTSSDDERGNVNMRDFKKELDVKLGGMSRMSRMNVVTINMIKKSNHPEVTLSGRGVNIDQSEDESSADDIDDILHTLSDSSECISPPLKVTSI